MLKKINMFLFFAMLTIGFNAYAEDVFYDDDFVDVVAEDEPMVSAEDEYADAVAADALDNYVVEGSLFERITTLEQEKVVMQLEKERAQLDLELDRLNAERIKLQMELDTLSGRAEQQQQELEAAKAQLEIQTEKLRRQRESIDEMEYEQPVATPSPAKSAPKREENIADKKYKLINVVGVGNQLQATIEDVSSGQNRRIAVGKELDGYIVKSISLNDGIVLEKGSESFSIGK